MIERTIHKVVYIAKDGKEFIDKKECWEYEKEFLDKIKYYTIRYDFDYTEGRGFESIAHVAVVPSGYDDAEVIAEKYAIDILNAGIFAGEGCQGFGLQKTYSLCNSTREKFEANEGVGWGCHSPHGTQVFISETAIEGFPKPYHYKREWGIK